MSRAVSGNNASAKGAGVDTVDRERDEIRLASREAGPGLRRIDLRAPGMRCAGCIRTVEEGLATVPGVEHVRVNLSTGRVAVRWRDADGPPALLTAMRRLGYGGANLVEEAAPSGDAERARLLRALAVAGFAATNIMLLSVSVWSGADGVTRDLFHWISAAIALPALAYSGRIFFASAWEALRRGRTNMDVPISVGLLLTFGLSLQETLVHGEHAYFDAASALVFFLLIGRTLDHMMRERARLAIDGLAKLAPRGATILRPDGGTEQRPLAGIEPGMALLVQAGDRVPVDGVVEAGHSELDASLVSGESRPQPVGAGSPVAAGTLNLGGALRLRVTATAEHSFLARMERSVEAAEAGRARYRRLADRAARLYSPLVHSAAIAAFAAWFIAGAGLQAALTTAISVLIITCPCALGLAVPMVQVVAARRLFERGVLVRDGAALERLAQCDTVVFDKTGTLTRTAVDRGDVVACAGEAARLALGLAGASRHPVAAAIATALTQRDTAPAAFEAICEVPGEGLEARHQGALYRLGRARWALSGAHASPDGDPTVLSRNGIAVACFHIEERLGPGAREAVATLAGSGFACEILSGDAPRAVAEAADALAIDGAQSDLRPDDKVARLEALARSGRRVLMVGDGLNDAPALAAAHASMAPGTAADVGRQAADLVFLRNGLDAVPATLALARDSRRLVRQNLMLAVGYNLVAVPVAVAGLVTPLVAAVAMSGSSLLVVGNALRLGRMRPADRARTASAPQRARTAVPVVHPDPEPAG